MTHLGLPTENKMGWTIDTIYVYFTMLRESDERFYEERDRRYTEVKNAEEKALRIKEEADKTALGLQRETQTYKDEKANELRSQIERERGSYVTQQDLRGVVDKFEALLKPVSEFISTQQGRHSVSDPAFDRLAHLVEKLTTVQTQGAGTVAGAGMTVDRIVQILTLLSTLGIGLKLVAN